jgi:hypothetical protein
MRSEGCGQGQEVIPSYTTPYTVVEVQQYLTPALTSHHTPSLPSPPITPHPCPNLLSHLTPALTSYHTSPLHSPPNTPYPCPHLLSFPPPPPPPSSP